MKSQRAVWEKIANSWNDLRTRVFHTIIGELASSWKPSRLLDIGCGNGRNLKPFAERGFDCVGTDFSLGMLKNADEKVVCCDASSLPFRDASFEYCLSIAVLHCIPSAKERYAALKELRRVLKVDGEALLTVWKEGCGQPFCWSGLSKSAGGKEQEKKWGDAKRYYYFFEPDELKALCIKAGFEAEEVKDARNIILKLHIK